MNPEQVSNYTVPHLNVVLPEKARKPSRVKSLNTFTPPPPDEETIFKLNAKAREYPFCIHYREKTNDPL
jgi:hypothetical protein